MNSSSLFKIYTLLPALLLTLTINPLHAQQHTSQDSSTLEPGAIERLNFRSVWKKSGNAAGFLLDKPFAYSELDATYEKFSGDFRRPQQALSGNSQTIHTAGNLLINDYYLTGAFNYKREQLNDVGFNASIIDPFRGMPFIIADLNSSEWRNQHYDLSFGLSSPQFKEKWSFGLSGAYQASSGAKQRDIRTANNYYKISVSPGLVYSPSKKHHIGLNLDYNNFKEEARMSNVSNYIDQAYYELLGLGTSVSYVGSGRTNNYIGNQIGAGLQYNYQGAIHIMARLNYAVEVEDLDISFTLPRNGATVIRHIWDAGLSFQKDGRKFTQGLEFSFYNRQMDGIQYVTERDTSAAQTGYYSIFKSIRSTYSSQRISAKYNLIAKSGSQLSYNWKLDAGIAYEKLADAYLLPSSVKQYENILFSLGGAKNFRISQLKASNLLLGLEMGYNKNKSGQYDYNGANADSPIVNGLEQNDFNYLSSDYFTASIPVTYSQRLNEKSRSTLFVKVYGQYIKTNQFDYNDRYVAGLSIGSNF